MDDRQIVLKACEDVLGNCINELDTLRLIWKEIKHCDFYHEIFDALIEYFVISPNLGYKEISFEYLEIILFIHLLKLEYDNDYLLKVYKKIIKNERLSPLNIDNLIKKHIN